MRNAPSPPQIHPSNYNHASQVTQGVQVALSDKPQQPPFGTEYDDLSSSRSDIENRSDKVGPESLVTGSRDPKAPTRPDFPFATGSTGVTLKPGGWPVKVIGQSGSSSSLRVEAEVVTTRSRLHKKGVLRKSRQLYQRYLEHHEKEGVEALGELCQSLQLYKRYLEHLGEEGNETLGRHEPPASGPLSVPAPPAPPEGDQLEKGAQDVLLCMSRQRYQRFLEHHEGEGNVALGELCQLMQLYKHYLERLGKNGNEALGRHESPASGPPPPPPFQLLSLLAEEVLLGEGAQDLCPEDFPVEQVVGKITEISQPQFLAYRSTPKPKLARVQPFRPWVSHVLSAEPPLKLDLRSDLSDLRSDLSDISDLRPNLSHLRSVLSHLRTDLSHLRSHPSDLRSHLSELQPVQPAILSYLWGPEASTGVRISRPYQFHHGQGAARVLVWHQEGTFIIL